MAENSKIEWTDATWNPWTGCTKISPACANCYMFDGMKRYGKDPTKVRRSAAPTFLLPLKRKQNKSFAIAPGSKVFTCSWSDWFHADADPWRDEAWVIIRQRPDVTFQVLTKRIDRTAECLPSDWGSGYPNVWLGTTVENQEWADKRIPHLLKIPAAVRFLSMEPLLGPVDLTPWLDPTGACCGAEPEFICKGCPARNNYVHDRDDIGTPSCGIDWVIVGGESGHGARPMHPDWVRSIRDQCQAAGVPFFFKQWGEWNYGSVKGQKGACLYNDGRLVDMTQQAMLDEERRSGKEHNRSAPTCMTRVGKKAAGRLLDGREWSEMPSVVENRSEKSSERR